MRQYAMYVCGLDPRLTVPYPDCPNAKQHTPSPVGYLEWHEWAEQMQETHQAKQCSGCGKWVIHEPIEVSA